MNYKNKLISNEWLYIQPDINKVKIINIFDDGNKKFSKYDNKWIIFGKFLGKIALFNKYNPEIIIYSISNWKIK